MPAALPLLPPPQQQQQVQQAVQQQAAQQHLLQQQQAAQQQQVGRGLLQLGSAPLNRTVAGDASTPAPPPAPPGAAVPSSAAPLAAPPGPATPNSTSPLGAVARPGVGVLPAAPPPPPPMGPGSVDLDQVEGVAVFVVTTTGPQVNATEAGERACAERGVCGAGWPAWFACQSRGTPVRTTVV